MFQDIQNLCSKRVFWSDKRYGDTNHPNCEEQSHIINQYEKEMVDGPCLSSMSAF